MYRPANVELYSVWLWRIVHTSQCKGIKEVGGAVSISYPCIAGNKSYSCSKIHMQDNCRAEETENPSGLTPPHLSKVNYLTFWNVFWNVIKPEGGKDLHLINTGSQQMSFSKLLWEMGFFSDFSV